MGGGSISFRRYGVNLPPALTPITQGLLEGAFEGWSPGAVFSFENGQTWKQTSFEYEYCYAYRPRAVVYEDRGSYFIAVDDMRSSVEVQKC